MSKTLCALNRIIAIISFKFVARMRTTLCCVYLFVLRSHFVQGTYDDLAYNYVTLIQMYKQNNVSTVDLIPRTNLSAPMVITAGMYAYALNDFDEVAGKIELSGALDISWTDQLVRRNSDSFEYSTGNTYFLVPRNKIWTPQLLLYNAVDGTSLVGDNAYMCRYNITSFEVRWNPRVFLKGACAPDISFYPFDRQTCMFKFVPWGFEPSELILQARTDSWDMGSFEENGEWSVMATNSMAWNDSSLSYLELSIVIERKPLYFAFNIIMPVLILCVLNTMVFWLPAESGERVGFSITCFLSFVVLLNMVMDFLPRSSSPLSLLCLYLVTMMLFSGAVSAFVIIEMNVFHRSDASDPPSWLQKFIRIVTFRSCKCKRHNEVEDTKTLTNTGIGKPDDHKLNTFDSKLSKQSKPGKADLVTTVKVDGQDDACHAEKITWPIIGRVLDKLLFCAFLGVELFFSVTFLLPLANRA